MSDAVAIALISSIGALAVAGVGAYYTYRSNQELFALKDQVSHQLERIQALEETNKHNRNVIEGWRKFWARFVLWLKERSMTGYPEPDKDLLETDPNIPKVVGK